MRCLLLLISSVTNRFVSQYYMVVKVWYSISCQTNIYSDKYAIQFHSTMKLYSAEVQKVYNCVTVSTEQIHSCRKIMSVNWSLYTTFCGIFNVFITL